LDNENMGAIGMEKEAGREFERKDAEVALHYLA
jgi:hypothetical protein